MMRFSASAIMTLPETLSSAVLIRRLLTASNFCAVMSARILDDLEGSAVAVQDRVVRGLQPDLPAALADAPVLTRIVFAAGFGSIPRFNSVFKQHVGMPPTEYRLMLRAPLRV